MPDGLTSGQMVGRVVFALVICRSLVWIRRRDPPATLSGRLQFIEGDTLIVRGERVRIASIDAPEQGLRYRGQIFGRGPGTLATAELRRVIAGRRAEVASIKRDRYGRLPAVVHAGDEDVGGGAARSFWGGGSRGHRQAGIDPKRSLGPSQVNGS